MVHTSSTGKQWSAGCMTFKAKLRTQDLDSPHMDVKLARPRKNAVAVHKELRTAGRGDLLRQRP